MIKNIFTVLMIIFPILSVYNSPIATLTLADILLIILMPFVLIDIFWKKKARIKLNAGMGLVFLYTVIQLLIIIIFCDSEYANKVTMPTIRILTYYGIITFFTKTYFNMELGLKAYKRVAIFVTCFLFIQILFFNIFNIYIPGTIPGLPVSEDLIAYNNVKLNGSTARFRSLFNEPSHYAIYVVLALGIELLAKHKIDKKSVIILTLGLLMSGSSTGILMVAILYLIYIAKNMRNFSAKTIRNLILLACVAMIIMPIYMQTQSFQIFYERTFENEQATEGRFGNYAIAFKDTNNVTFFFGRGILKIEDYIAAFPRIFYYYGLVGMIFFGIVTIRNFIRLKGINLVTWLILFILIFPTEMLFGKFILLYMPFMDYRERYEEE